jgi:hypothetical protein
MASQSTTTVTRAKADDDDIVAGAKEATKAAADGVKSAVDTVSRSVPDIARTSRSLMDDAMRAIERGSDERISAGVTLSLGLAIGMLIGGAPRLLTMLALVPVAAIGLVMVDRRGSARATRTAASAG